MTRLQHFLVSFQNCALWSRIWLVLSLMFSISLVLAFVGGQVLVLGYLAGGVIMTVFGVLFNLALLKYGSKRKNE